MRLLHELMGILARLNRVVERRLGLDVYRLRENEIVYGSFVDKRRIAVSDIEAWSVYMEMGFDVITIEFPKGACTILIDKDGDLTDILRQVANDKEKQSGSF